MSRKMVTSDYTIGEILAKVAAQKETAAKIEELKTLSRREVREFFEIIYNPDIKFSFKLPNFKDSETRNHNYFSSLKSKLKVIRHLADDGQYGKLAEEKRVRIAMDLIDALQNDEARLLHDLFKKQFKYKGVTKPVIKAVYPSLKDHIEA